jgi:hypothetical protein
MSCFFIITLRDAAADALFVKSLQAASKWDGPAIASHEIRKPRHWEEVTAFSHEIPKGEPPVTFGVLRPRQSSSNMKAHASKVSFSNATAAEDWIGSDEGKAFCAHATDVFIAVHP